MCTHRYTCSFLLAMYENKLNLKSARRNQGREERRETTIFMLKQPNRCCIMVTGNQFVPAESSLTPTLLVGNIWVRTIKPLLLVLSHFWRVLWRHSSPWYLYDLRLNCFCLNIFKAWEEGMEFAALELDWTESLKAAFRTSEKMMGREPQQWLQNPMWSHDHAESFMKVMSSRDQTSRIINKK